MVKAVSRVSKKQYVGDEGMAGEYHRVLDKRWAVPSPDAYLFSIRILTAV